MYYVVSLLSAVVSFHAARVMAAVVVVQPSPQLMMLIAAVKASLSWL